jgi:hypothetical protein
LNQEVFKFHHFIFQFTINSTKSIASQSQHSQAVDLETFPLQPVLSWSTDYESGDDQEYDPTDDIPSDGSEFEPDLDASSDDDSVYWTNELHYLGKEENENELVVEEEKNNEEEEDEAMDEEDEESSDGSDEGVLYSLPTAAEKYRAKIVKK